MKKDVKISLMENGKLSRGGWLSIVAFLLVAVIALSVALGLVVKAGKNDKSKDEAFVEAGGTVVNTDDTEVHGLSLETVEIAPQVLSSSGVAPILAESSYEIHASYNTEVGTKDLSWTWAWKDGSSGKWGNGKDVSTYVDFKVSTDTLTLTASVKEAFGEQIVVTAKNVAVPSVTKSATFDYAQRVTDVSFSSIGSASKKTFFQFSSVNSSDRTHTLTEYLMLNLNYTYSDVYSIEDTFEVTNYTLVVNSRWAVAFKGAISGNELYTGAAKAVIDALDIGRSVDVGTRIPNISYLNILCEQLFGNSYTSSTELDNTLKTLFAVAASVGIMENNPVFNVRITVTGQYSTFTSSGAMSDGSCGLGFSSSAFGLAATPGSLEFDSTSKVF